MQTKNQEARYDIYLCESLAFQRQQGLLQYVNIYLQLKAKPVLSSLFEVRKKQNKKKIIRAKRPPRTDSVSRRQHISPSGTSRPHPSQTKVSQISGRKRPSVDALSNGQPIPSGDCERSCLLQRHKSPLRVCGSILLIG